MDRASVTGVYPHDDKVFRDGCRLYDTSICLIASPPRPAAAPLLADTPGHPFQLTVANADTLEIIDRIRLDQPFRPWPFTSDDKIVYSISFTAVHQSLRDSTGVVETSFWRRCGRELRCPPMVSLEKDRARRLDSASAARLEIDDALAAPAAESLPVVTPHRMRALPIGLALIGSGALVAALISWGLTPPAPAADPATRLAVNLEPGVYLGEAAREALFQQRPGLTGFALSPDGRQLVYVGHDGKTSQLYVRHLDRDRAVAIAGTTGAQNPFFSPDGRHVGFFIAAPERRDADGAVIGAGVNANGAIRRAAIAGGPVRTVEISGPAASVFPSATWSADDTILLSGPEGIYRVPASGGTIERLIAEPRARFPELLPGGRAVVFSVIGLDGVRSVAMEALETHQRTMPGSRRHISTLRHIGPPGIRTQRKTHGRRIRSGNSHHEWRSGGGRRRRDAVRGRGRLLPGERNRAVCRVTFRRPRVRGWRRLRGAETCLHAGRSEGCRYAAAGFPREHVRSYDLA